MTINVEAMLFILFLIYVFKTVLFETYIWQIKEYRIDRILSFLSTPSGKRLIINKIVLIKWILLIFSFVFVRFVGFYLFAFIIFVLYFVQVIRFLIQLFTKKSKIPRFTLRAIFVVFLSFILALFGFLMPLRRLIVVLFLDRVLSLIVLIAVEITGIPSYFYKKIFVFLAKEKIKKCKNLIVVGITGSFGKTSTKEFVASLLSQKYNVLKTEGFNNTEIGVALTIVQRLKEEHEIFIVEMGAYKRGEIEAICNMVFPRIGIITGINEQHIQLFGSQNKLIQAKFELVENLRKGGTIIFNIGNKYVQKMMKHAKRKRPDLSVITYQRKYEKANAPMLFSSSIQIFPSMLLFKLHFEKMIIHCSAKLAGVQNIDNILASVATSFKLGLTKKQIISGIKKLQSSEKTMKIVGKLGKLLLIDDTFNTNPDGVSAAIDYMSIFPGKKILILTPLIELGNKSYLVHGFLAKRAVLLCDLILLTNINYTKAFLNEASKNGSGGRKVQVINTKIAVKLIISNSNSKGIVIFEGREAGKILNELKLSKRYLKHLT